MRLKNQSYHWKWGQESQRVNKKKGRNKGSQLLISHPRRVAHWFYFRQISCSKRGSNKGRGCSWLSGFCSHLQQGRKRRATIQITPWERAKKRTKHKGNRGQRRWETIHYKSHWTVSLTGLEIFSETIFLMSSAYHSVWHIVGTQILFAK